VLLALVVMIGTEENRAQDPPALPQVADAQQLKKSDRSVEESTKLRPEDKPVEHVSPWEKLSAATQLVSLNKQVLQLLDAGKAREALPLARQAVDYAKKAWGEEHFRYATTLNNLAMLYFELGEHARAELLYRQALEIMKQTLGETHPDYALYLNNLAGLYVSMGEYARAEPFCRQALEIRKQTLGETHPGYAISLNNLAGLYKEMGEYARAEPLYRQALEIMKRGPGRTHSQYATSLNNLAGLYKEMGEYARAEPLYRQALEIREKALGETHPAYSTSLNDLAGLYRSMGDYARAEPLYRQSLEIKKQTLGETHPRYAASLNGLAVLYRSMRDYARAEPLYRQALEIHKKALGETHPEYARSLNNLAVLYWSMGEYARAEPLYRQALEITKKALGEAHPDYAVRLNGLATLYVSMGEYARAEPLYRQSLEIKKQTLGETHPDYAVSLNNLALLRFAQGDTASAAPLLTTFLEIVRRNLDLTAAIQSERQQLAMARTLRPALDHLLSLDSGTSINGTPAYHHVLLWKGTIFARQQRMLHARHELELVLDANVPAAGAAPQGQGSFCAAFGLIAGRSVVLLYDEWQQTSRRLATLAFAVPDPKNQETWKKRLGELTDKKEQLERELSRMSASFRAQREQQRPTPDQVQAVLRKNEVLIDFLAYNRCRPPAKDTKKLTWEPHLAAFVVRAGRPVVQIDLGPLEEINQAIAAWRTAVKDPAKDTSAPAVVLRRRLWQPLEKYLDGVQTVLVSPDGALAQFPFAALPGRQPGSYLLEEVAIAVVPVPQLLPELLQGDARTAGTNAPRSSESLLLVGDVDYGAPAARLAATGTSRSAPRGRGAGGLPVHPRLKNTGDEAKAVQQYFQRRYPDGQARLLAESEATEEAVRQEAPKHRYLHLATHGFFAPPELHSTLGPPPEPAGAAAGPGLDDFFGRHGVSGFHPGLLSGLVLAGANRPAQPDHDDGILTALEVTEMDLNGVELAVLSACETGLGEEAGGEGLLGLQRAFQVAGARSVVASLWKVKDQPGRQLMQRFYENLWQNQKKLSKLEALRQAQLSMMTQLSKIGNDPERGPGQDNPPPKTEAKPLKNHPYFWASFVLSGDWR
jgi:CHAT domain-containing protein/tetratricopeptide (TPR) repeat protein